MNLKKLDAILDAYSLDFDKNWEEEKYKWIEVKRFQDNYRTNCTAADFLVMLRAAIDPTSNLVASHHYYPFSDLEILSDIYPQDVQSALNDLFDEEQELMPRVEQYEKRITEIKEKSESYNTTYAKDRRFITTLLFFKYPNKYTIYKYTEIKKFCDMCELGITIKKGANDYIFKSKTIVEIVAAHLSSNREDIISLYKNKLKKGDYFQDENLLLLAQNVIWYATTYDHNEGEELKAKEFVYEHGHLKESFYTPKIGTAGVKKDHIAEAKKHAKTGLVGESFVLEYENQRLKKFGKQAVWKAQDEGDGLGYDILSYNEDGTERFIEVKTTSAGKNTPFFITATELEACKLYGEIYFLYRVYKEADEWKIAWYQGKEVEALCNCPHQYIVTSHDK